MIALRGLLLVTAAACVAGAIYARTANGLVLVALLLIAAAIATLPRPAAALAAAAREIWGRAVDDVRELVADARAAVRERGGR